MIFRLMCTNLYQKFVPERKSNHNQNLFDIKLKLILGKNSYSYSIFHKQVEPVIVTYSDTATITRKNLLQ